SIHGLPTNDQSRTLVILDGITLNKSDLGSVNWNLINKNNIEKIKVIKGPGPAKYGSNAMGGVIEITSKKISEKLSGEISASYGSYNTMSLNTLISNSKKYNNNTFYYSLSGTGQRSDGYITEPKQFIETADSIIIPVFFKELNTNLKSGCIINNKHNFEAQFNYFDDIRSTGIKVFENKGAHSKHTTYNAYLKYSNYENSKIKYNIVAFYSSEFYNRLYEYLKEGEYMLYLADVIREDKGINIDIDLNYSKIHNISGGFNYKNGNVKGSDIYYTSSDKVNNSGNIDNVALYIQDEINFNKKLILNAGIRYDIAQFTKGLFNIENPSYTLIFYKNFENENIKSKYWNTINPRINLEYKLSEKFNTYISFAKGFKTPLLDDMCRTGKQKNRFKIANPNLTPEHLYVYETGIDYNFKNITTSISAYYSIGKDFMYYASTGDTVNMGYKLAPIMMKQNIGKVEIYGCETEIKYDLKNFLLIYANHTYTHSKIIQHKINTASDSSLTGKYLTDIPIHKISSGIIWKNNILNVSLLYKYTGKIWINDLNTIDEYLLTNKLPDYSIYSIKFYKAFKNRYEIEINIENIFNKIIIDSNLQRNPGRFVTTLFRFKF
ncbi:MAG TPA: TonB-dependent receptor, partial [Bacteroidales bacterium]|nr:TonB-dependent receptor [Bacteroidales bacterium]